MTYMTQEEMEELETLLKYTLDDTIFCWKATRLNGSSASLACDGNISIRLLRAFDEIAKEINTQERLK